MTTLDFSWKPKRFNFDKDGNPIEEELPSPVAYSLAFVLGESIENKEKFYDWHLQLYLNKKIIVDDADKKLLRATVAGTDRLSALIGAQILKSIDAAGSAGSAGDAAGAKGTTDANKRKS